MGKIVPLLIAIAVVVLVPIALRPRDGSGGGAGRTLVVITPHNEAIRHEFGRAFAAYHRAKTGEEIRIDWRTPGGTSEITRYLGGEYLASFRYYWERTLGRKWSGEVERSFNNAKVKLEGDPSRDTPEQQARRAFLASKVGCRIDVFFGGGAFDFKSQAGKGQLVDSGVVKAHPEWFGPNGIPQELGGEPFWDPKGCWIGTCLSAFGICYNTDSLARLGIDRAPAEWADLKDPRYFRQVALANPTQSASVNRAFEMLIQQQMQAAVAEASQASGGALRPEAEASAKAAGWSRAMQLLIQIGANARYFTDSSTKVALDVVAGEAAAGMTIDFYGRFESEAVQRPDGASRLQYANASGGTSFGADPVGMLRGAPEPELAREFVEWCISPEAQKLWNWKAGAPGGPERYALRRLPILPALYAPQFRQDRSDPDVDPYALAKTFTYREDWTGPLFQTIAFIVRVMCIDPHDELRDAWRALIDAGFPPEATAALLDVSRVDYAAAQGRIREALGPVKIREVQLAKELGDGFRAQYQRAAELARAGK